MNTPRLRILITLGGVFLLLIIAGHSSAISFLYQTSNFFPAIGLRLYALLLAILFLGSFYGHGLFICPIIGLKNIPRYMQIPVHFFIGFTLSTILVYLLGFLDMLHREILFLVILFGAFKTIKKIVMIPLNTFQNFRTSPLEYLEKWVWGCLGVFLIGRLFPVLNFNPFGDPLFYSLPAGRDYLKGEGFQWFEHAEFYWQAGLSDIGLIYIHSITSHPMLVQLIAQAFFYLTGTLFLLIILHKGLFSKWIPEKHSLWLSFSFVAMDTFRLESIVAKSDYWLAVLLCLIIVCLYEILTEETQANRLLFWKLILLFGGLCLSIKVTSILFLLPLGTGILLFGARLIPWKSNSFWKFVGMAMVLGLLNPAKNLYIFGSPTIPFAGNIFQSPYWDREGLDGIHKLALLGHGNFLDYPHVIFQFLLGHPVSLLFVLVALIWWKNHRTIEKFPAPLLNLLKIICFSWIGGLILWMIVLDPQRNPRYIIGFVFLTLILIVTIAIFIFRPIFLQNHSRWQYVISGIALLLTLSVSHTDVDFNQSSHWISSKSFYHQWKSNSQLAQVQDYLNNNSTPETRVLFNYTTQRFHANFIVYGARSFSPRTRFVYSKDENQVKEGLKRIKPKYYVIRKDKIKNSGVLLAKKTYLDENFRLIKNFKKFLLYQVH